MTIKAHRVPECVLSCLRWKIAAFPMHSVLIKQDDGLFWLVFYICGPQGLLIYFQWVQHCTLCQCERQAKRQAGKAVIQSEVLRINRGSSSFSNYPPAGILVVLDNNGSAGVRLSPLKCGWRKPASVAEQRNVCFSVMSSRVRPTGFVLSSQFKAGKTVLFFFCFVLLLFQLQMWKWNMLSGSDHMFFFFRSNNYKVWDTNMLKPVCIIFLG